MIQIKKPDEKRSKNHKLHFLWVCKSDGNSVNKTKRLLKSHMDSEAYLNKNKSYLLHNTRHITLLTKYLPIRCTET